MKLLTQEIIKALPPFYTTEGILLKDRIVICKFFAPDFNWTWYVFEGQAKENDFILWGMVHGHFEEEGYFALSELESVRGPWGLPIERDISVFKVPYGKLVRV